MKGSFCAMLLAVSPIGCSDGDDGAGRCNHDMVGVWDGATRADELTIGSDLSFRYAGPDGCVSTGTFSCPDQNVASGTMQVSVLTSAGGVCLPAGNYVCGFALNGDTLAYDCTGGGALQYTRQ